MVRLFRRWFGNSKAVDANNPPEPAEPSISDAEMLRDYFSPSPQALSALADLVEIIVKPLDAAARERLVAYVHHAEPGEDASSILDWVLTRDVSTTPEVIDTSDWCLCISVDWRASYDIEWQANQMLDTLGVAERWTWRADGDVPAGLSVLGRWLHDKGYVLLHLDTGSDEYTAFAVRHEDLDRVLALAKAAGADISTDIEFRS
ncbi:hypothetical protein BPS26883_00870 [Burkholderia pseudomultivorans]|uniref:DUF6630 domain-containing protein n=2 Tax=Burkholderia pseudomultivorans TaxID=1207504 RepID=A0A6P2HTJ7_9BURK|nr:hypothetical protein BPS26883_00870 [Burkholderia pseudomultivorans]